MRQSAKWTWTKNRNVKDAACRTLPPKQPGQECDEYPFATTVQGAGRGDGNPPSNTSTEARTGSRTTLCKPTCAGTASSTTRTPSPTEPSMSTG
ncbi:NucA/NucB deoxyribonuclease domain-containing protein [Amycolatopsis japonica]